MALWPTQQIDLVAAKAANLPANDTVQSGVRCHSSVGPHACAGQIYVKRLPDTNEVRWHCPVCLDEGVIQLDGT
jgi:hypothetical protein